MSQITQSLEKIVNWQQGNFPEQRLSFLRSGSISLRSGLTHQQIEALTSNFPFKLTKELYELYQYSGEVYQYKSGSIELTPEESLFSFEKALAINEESINMGRHKIIVKSIVDSYEEKTTTTFIKSFFKNQKHQHLIESPSITEYKFVIGSGFGKEAYYVVCEQEEKDSSPVLVQFISEPPLMFSKSLNLWILMIAEGYETGGYYIDKDGYFDVDYDKMKKIFYKYNPELSETWKYIYG